MGKNYYRSNEDTDLGPAAIARPEPEAVLQEELTVCAQRRLGQPSSAALLVRRPRALGTTASGSPHDPDSPHRSFARDREIADRFTNLGVFHSAPAVKDTERPSVIEAQRWLKSELYKQTALGGGAKTPALAEASAWPATATGRYGVPIWPGSRWGTTSR